jgi:hypothetical protein
VTTKQEEGAEMADQECPLCGQDAKPVGRHPQHPRKLIQGFACDRCGTYYITAEAADELGVLRRREPGRSAILSGVTREQSERDNPITICSSSYDPRGAEPVGMRIDEALDTLAARSIPERMDRVLLNLARRSHHPGDAVRVDPERDYPLLHAENAQAAQFALDHMVRSGLLDRPIAFDQGGGDYALTVDGWAKIDELSAGRPESRQGFVAMWFDPQLNDVWDNGLRPAIEQAGYGAVRIDMAEFNERIDDRIIAEIRRSRFVVADVTEHRQAVYFEAGFAMGLGLPVIFTCREDHMEKCNFDTRQYNHIVWKSPDDLREKLKNRIAATIV